MNVLSPNPYPTKHSYLTKTDQITLQQIKNSKQIPHLAKNLQHYYRKSIPKSTALSSSTFQLPQFHRHTLEQNNKTIKNKSTQYNDKAIRGATLCVCMRASQYAGVE